MSREEIEYQVRRHVSDQMQQWPHLDPEQTRADIRARVVAGRAWLWPMPVQMDLFAKEAAR